MRIVVVGELIEQLGGEQGAVEGEEVAPQPSPGRLLLVFGKSGESLRTAARANDLAEREHFDGAVEGGLGPLGALGDGADLAAEPREERDDLRGLGVVDGADANGAILGQHGYSSRILRIVMRLMRRGSAEAIVNCRCL